MPHGDTSTDGRHGTVVGPVTSDLQFTVKVMERRQLHDAPIYHRLCSLTMYGYAVLRSSRKRALDSM